METRKQQHLGPEDFYEDTGYFLDDNASVADTENVGQFLKQFSGNLSKHGTWNDEEETQGWFEDGMDNMEDSEDISLEEYTGILTERTECGENKRELNASFTEKRTNARKTDIKEVYDILVREKLIICMGGKELFVKKEEFYTSISSSKEHEVMYLRCLFKPLNLNLKASDAVKIVKALKTEPDIYVENINRKADGEYDISFYGGDRICAEGDLEDFLITGSTINQIKPFTEGIRIFVNECCEINARVKTGSSALFYAYRGFMSEYPEYNLAQINQLVPFIKKVYGLQGSTNGKRRFIIGICLKNNS